jgi:hypothetical protein
MQAMRWRSGWFLAAALVALVVGCSTRGPVPDVPLAKSEAPFGNIRLLVVATPPEPVPENPAATKLNEEWFADFHKAFEKSALAAGFRVLSGGDFDLRVTLSAADLDARRDALDKRVVVRARLDTGGKSQEVLGEIAYQLTETDFEIPGDHDRWMVKPNSHAWFSNHLLNQLMKESRVIALAGGATAAPSGGGKVAGGGKKKGGAFVTGAPQRNAYALIIGVEKYRDVKTKALGAGNDAKIFANLVKQTMGVPDKNVRVAIGDRATKSDIEKHVDWLITNVPKGGRIYLFFSGHGAPDGAEGTPFLLPYDGDPAALERTALPLQTILDRLEKSPATDAIAFVDTCFSGAGGRSVLPEGARPLVRVKKTEATAKVALLSASSGEQISGPSADKKNGVFTRYVTEGVGRGQADVDGDGQVTLQELAGWVKPRVEREAKAQGRDQSPQLSSPSGAQPSDMVVAHGVK